MEFETIEDLKDLPMEECIKYLCETIRYNIKHLVKANPWINLTIKAVNGVEKIILENLDNNYQRKYLNENT